jgi:hypothetical protein
MRIISEVTNILDMCNNCITFVNKKYKQSICYVRNRRKTEEEGRRLEFFWRYRPENIMIFAEEGRRPKFRNPY